MGTKKHEIYSEDWFISEINKSKGSIFYYALKRLQGCKEDAEDICQTTILKAWKHRTQYKPTFAFSTWLFKILNNTLIDFLRNKNQVVIVSMSKEKTIHTWGGDKKSYPYQDLRSSRKNMDDIINEELLVEEIERYLLKISSKGNPIGSMFLHYAEGVPYKEIATIYGKPIGTIKASIFRAQRKIVEKMTSETMFKKEKKVYRKIKKVHSIPIQGEHLKELVLVENK